MRFVRTARTTLIVVLAALVLPAAASASTGKQYVLPHPRRERCKAHYVKKVERIKGRKETVCVYVAPKPATFVLVNDEGVGLATGQDVRPHVRVSGSATVVGGHDLIGVPITYTITNQSSGQALGSFTEPSDPVQPCALFLRTEGNTQMLVGEAEPPELACPIAVSLPTGQLAELTGSFAGNSSYAPSVSTGLGI